MTRILFTTEKDAIGFCEEYAASGYKKAMEIHRKGKFWVVTRKKVDGTPTKS